MNSASAIVPRQAENDRHLINMYLYQKYQSSKNTFRVYKRVIEEFLTLVQKPINQISIADLLRFQHQLAQTGLSPATQAQRISVIRSLMSWARKLNYIQYDPSEVVQVPRVTPVTVSRYLSKDELTAIIAAAKARSQRDYLVILFLVLTGVRVSEATSARWCDIFESPTGAIGLRIIGKGVQSRLIRLPEKLWSLICARRRRAGLPVAVDPTDERPLLATRSGKALSATSVNKIVRRAARAAGITKRVSAHWIRHAHGTHALLGGCPIDMVAANLGHRSIETTRRYLHSCLGRSTARTP